MSVDHHIYTDQKIAVTCMQLLEALKHKGWHAFFLESDNFLKQQVGVAISSEILLATRISSVAQELGIRVERSIEVSLEQLHKKDKIAICTLAFDHFNFEEEYGESDAADLAEQLGEEWATRMRSARAQYVINSAASRPTPTLKFQTDVWEALGESTGGLMEDPQTGECIVFKEGKKRILVPGEADVDFTEDSSVLDAITPIIRFVKQAKDRGFPTQGEGGQAEVITANLDVMRMEELLDLGQECVPVCSDYSFSQELLNEYLSNKDEDFETEHWRWIRRMKNRHAWESSVLTSFWIWLDDLFALLRGK